MIILLLNFMCSCVGDPITELPPGNNTSNQNNKGFIAGISVTVIIIVVFIIGGAVIIFYVRQNKTSILLQGILMHDHDSQYLVH